MSNVYVVVENGELYPLLYSSYEAARKVVTTKYADVLREELEEAEGMEYDIASQIVDENTDETGTTYLYIEKGIHIIIQRYSVPITI